jgi:hypothetical protein
MLPKKLALHYSGDTALKARFLMLLKLIGRKFVP